MRSASALPFARSEPHVLIPFLNFRSSSPSLHKVEGSCVFQFPFLSPFERGPNESTPFPHEAPWRLHPD